MPFNGRGLIIVIYAESRKKNQRFKKEWMSFVPGLQLQSFFFLSNNSLKKGQILSCTKKIRVNCWMKEKKIIQGQWRENTSKCERNFPWAFRFYFTLSDFLSSLLPPDVNESRQHFYRIVQRTEWECKSKRRTWELFSF